MLDYNAAEPLQKDNKWRVLWCHDAYEELAQRWVLIPAEYFRSRDEHVRAIVPVTCSDSHGLMLQALRAVAELGIPGPC